VLTERPGESAEGTATARHAGLPSGLPTVVRLILLTSASISVLTT